MIYIRNGATNYDCSNVLYENILKTGVVTDSGSTSPYFAAALKEDETYSSWRGNDAASWIKVDAGSARYVNAVAIVGHTLFSDGASFNIEYSADGVSYVAATENITPTDNSDIFAMLQNINARYWRVNVINGPATISCMMIGYKLPLGVTPLIGHKPLHHSRKHKMMLNESLGGQFLGNRINKVGIEGSVNLGYLDRKFVESEVSPFEEHYNNGGTFMWAADPVNSPNDMGYCSRADGGNEMEIVFDGGPELAAVSFEVKAYAR